MRRSGPLVAALLAGALAASPLPASACSCTNNLTTQEEFDDAWRVFSGRVVGFQPEIFGTIAVLFEPIQRWKGPLDYVQVVLTPPDEAVCGYPFELGEEYLVFANLTYTGITYSPAAFTHLCARTAPLAGNPYVSELPPPLVTTPASRRAWGSLKVRYR